MKKIVCLAVAAFSAAVIGLSAGCGGQGFSKQENKGEAVIRAGMDAAYPPFGSQDLNSKEYVGFDVDIIKAVAAEENLKVQVKNVNFDGLIPALQTGDIDVAINDITITDDRAKSVDFSKRYYIAGLGVVVKADNDSIVKKEDLKGKTLGVTIGSTGEEAARKIEGADVRVYNTLSDAFIDLKHGAVEGVVNDTNDNSVKTAPVALTTENLGIAVKKGNTELLAKIESGLAKIKKNGKFAEIYRKWFGKNPPQALLEE